MCSSARWRSRPTSTGSSSAGIPPNPTSARVRGLAASLGIAARVTFAGMVSPREVAAHLAAADILVLPNVETTISSDYSSPLKLFEYLAARRAVVASDLPAFGEVVAHERDALLVAPGDPGALAAALQRLAGDPDLAARLAAQAVERARGFSWDVRAATIGRVIEEVGPRGARRAPAASARWHRAAQGAGRHPGRAGARPLRYDPAAAMISPRLRALVSCPDCRSRSATKARGSSARNCHRAFMPGHGFIDLRPADAFTETTKYTDEALHVDARHEHVSPPLLGAGVRNRMLRDFLALAPGDRVIDLGCGSGRIMVWNHDTGAWMVGVDVAPYFAHEAIEQSDLVLGDLRRLPFPDGSFTKAWSLDVFEHLSKEALEGFLHETARVMAPGGAVFVYTHVRKNAAIAKGLRWINRFAGWLERRGLIDMTVERLRKSDHLNPLADIPDLEQTVAAAGFRIARIRYYTPLIGGFIENILMRVAEHAMADAGAQGVAGPRTTTRRPRRARPARRPRRASRAAALCTSPCRR